MITNDKILAKVEKLFRLAEKAGTAEEATTAMGMASELLAKYGLNLQDLKEKAPQEENFGVPEKEFLVCSKRVILWKSKLANIIAKEHCCKIWRVPKSGIVILGHEKNKQIVKYLYNSFVRQIDDMTKRNAYGRGGDYVNSYRHGVVDTLGRRLKGSTEKAIKKEYQENANNSSALVVIDRALELQKKLQQEVLARTPRLTKSKGSKMRSDGYYHGQKDGNKISISSGAGSISSGIKKIGS